MAEINSRELILDLLVDVDKNKLFINEEVGLTLRKYQYLDKQVRAFVTKVSEGTVEYRIKLDYIINQFSKVKANKCKPVIRNILRMSVYQIFFMDSVPDSAVCNEAVSLAKKKGFKTLTGFVNGVLRNIIRNKDSIVYPDRDNDTINFLSIEYSIPSWIIEFWNVYYSYDIIEKMLNASMERKETTIRCNTTKVNVDQLTTMLQSENICVEKGSYVDTALKISNYDHIGSIEAFKRGLFQVQDESSMLVSLVADPSKGDMVVDVCAAPGGKTIHMADLMENTGKVIARDISDRKTNLINENIERIGFENVDIQCFDATKLDNNLIGKADIVIADLPCSGLGIIGKKNDIKYHITRQQLDELVELQRDILNVVHQYVKKNGKFIFSTCTVDPLENIENVRWIEENLPLMLVSIDEELPKNLICEDSKNGYVQLLSGIHNCDGFFIAKFVKVE